MSKAEPMSTPYSYYVNAIIIVSIIAVRYMDYPSLPHIIWGQSEHVYT